LKVSEITTQDIVDYLGLDTAEAILTPILVASKKYVSNYTGIPIESTITGAETLDTHDDFYIVVMILCQDMHDNRSMYVDKSNLNRVVETILGMHCTNLLPTPDVVV